jgi:hypothetical protein
MFTLNQKISILQNDLSGLSHFSKEISGGILEDSISSILFLNEKLSYIDLSLGHIIEDDLGIRTSQLSIRPENDLQDAVQEIYSKNGTATLKLGDDNAGTLTFNNILKSENGNASFYGSGEKKYMEYNSTDDKIILLKDTVVNGDIICNGNFELGTITDLEQKIIDISNNSSSGGGGGTINEGDFSSKLDVSNQGTGPALKVSQFGVGDDQDVALFNAGLEGDALKIDSCGNSHFYKHVNVSGTMTSNSPWALLGQTIDGDSADDWSGYSVSINAKGDIVAIGAFLDDNIGTSSGSTKMYQYTDGSWNQLGQTIDGDSGNEESGYSVSINAKGDIVAIGARYDDNNGNDSGSTKMYQYTNGTWNKLGQTIDGDSIGDESGISVSINAKGDIVAIGAYLDEDNYSDSGSTKMYQYTNGSWNQLGQTIDGDSSGDSSGYSVSINAKGDIVAIGALWDDNNGTDSGSTKMYQYTNGSWNQLGQTINGDSADDWRGNTVSINAKGDIVAIGAIRDDNNANNSGSTKIYQYTDGSWNQLGQTIDGDSADDLSGYSVSINAKGDIVAIGARLDDNNGTDSGSTKMYQYTDGSWNQLGQTIDGDSADDWSGYSVSINAKGDIVAIGVVLDDNNGTNSGSTKIYQKGLRGNVTIEDDLSVGGDLIVNGGIYTDNFSVADTTGHTTIGGDLSISGTLRVTNDSGGPIMTNGNEVMFDTIVLTGSVAIKLHELQLWVNSTNILPIYTNSTSNDVAGEPIGNTIEFFDKTTNLTQKSWEGNFKASFIANNVLTDIPHSRELNSALYIPMTTHININNIQSFVLYSRKSEPSISLGLRIELYNRIIDPLLSSPIIKTNSIDISGATYRFDFPAINKYTNVFVIEDSLTQIVSDDYAITETTMAPRTSQTTLDVNGEIDCTEIKVNSIPLNSFYNFTYGYNYTPTLPGIYFGWGCHIQLDTSTFNNAYSHFQTFRRDEDDIHSFRCESNYLGTYEITAHVIYRNKQGIRHNPCIAIGVNDDVCHGAIGANGTGPNWDVGLTTGYCQHNIFSTQYVKNIEGKVSNLSCSRIYHFTNTTDKISINTFIEGAAGDLFNEAAVSSVYKIINAGISFKYIGNFNNITYDA